MEIANKILIGLVLFYTFFFACLGIIPQNEISFDYDTIEYNETGGVSYTAEESVNNVSGVYQSNQIYSKYSWSDYLTNFIDNIFVNISGIPVIINVLIFSPLVIFSAYWLIIFILRFVPWLG